MANKIDVAVAQFVGFTHGVADSNDIQGLASCMGLTKQEWAVIKEQERSLFSTSDIIEIDSLFKKDK